MINSVFNLAIGIIICFLDGPLVVMLILGFFCLSLPFITLMIIRCGSYQGGSSQNGFGDE